MKKNEKTRVKNRSGKMKLGAFVLLLSAAAWGCAGSVFAGESPWTEAEFPIVDEEHDVPPFMKSWGGSEKFMTGSLPEAYEIRDFEPIMQLPQLPTGCEITSMTMVLRYLEYPISKVEMAAQYLPKLPMEIDYGMDDEGNQIGPDLDCYFVGDPFSIGTVCGTTAITDAVEAYFEDIGEEEREVLDLTGASADELYGLISEDHPVVVWVTIDMEPRFSPEDEWYTEDGRYMSWSVNDHAMVLIGYNPDVVLMADPLEGIIEYGRQEFENVYEERGNRAVVIR